MGQTKKHSLYESISNVVVGIITGLTISQLAHIYEHEIQHYIWPSFTWELSATSNLVMTLILTGASMVRSYVIRRIFNSLPTKGFDTVDSSLYNDKQNTRGE